MSKALKCPMCQSADIETYKDNPDDKGMCWYTYYECRKCGRTCRDYDWMKLTDYEQETIKTKMLTAEVERLKAEVERLKNKLALVKKHIVDNRDALLFVLKSEHDRAAYCEFAFCQSLIELINTNTGKGGEDE